MEDDTISSNTCEVVPAALANTSEDDPQKKTDNLLQISSDKCKNDKGIALCKVEGCEEYPQRTREGFCVTHYKLLADDAGGHEHNEVGSSDAAPTISPGGSRKRERTNNGAITNLLSSQVLSLVPNIKIPDQVSMLDTCQ